MIMSAVGPGIKIDCAGEDQQQFIRPVTAEPIKLLARNWTIGYNVQCRQKFFFSSQSTESFRRHPLFCLIDTKYFAPRDNAAGTWS
jgi:hypothetical protein